MNILITGYEGFIGKYLYESYLNDEKMCIRDSMDAEERKAELMKENKLGDGKMFKMDFDQRVIGTKVLPDGTHKTGVGDFIRRTSLDEFPQFFNVLNLSLIHIYKIGI